MKRTKQDQNLTIAAHDWMFLSGAVVLGFLILHLSDLTWRIRPDIDYSGHGPAELALIVLSNPISRIVYAIGTLFLGWHLWHGFYSGFQTLGLVHPKYTPLIKVIGYIFAVAIALGFFSLPVLFPEMHPKETPRPASSQHIP